MKTAILSATATSTARTGSAGGATSSAASESAVDAYATRVLESSTPSDAFFDTSLGPYVASVLRAADIEGEDVTSLAEFDSLLELLEDQCNMQRDKATTALQSISKAVVTGIVPYQESPFSIKSPLGGLYAKSNLDSFQSSKVETEDSLGFEQKLEQLSIDPYTPCAAGGPSPLKPDNLIPVDLLGFLDDPSPHQQQNKYPYATHALDSIPAAQAPAFMEEHKTASNEEAFPPLGAAATPSPAASLSSSGQKVSLSKKAKGKGKTKARNSDKELAAALFRPSRPRQNSIDKEESSPVLASTNSPQTSAQTPQHLYATDRYFQQQVDSCVEILLSMNGEVGEGAATEAALMAKADFNVAQYIIDRALSAPPVCRHMLHDGCYRSDCQFSHDVEGHTCLFWLRGRCTKPVSVCKFLHGFHPRHMEGIVPSSSSNMPGMMMPPPNMGYGGYPPTGSPGFGGYSLTSPSNATSWQPTTPSLAESSASNSYASSAGSSTGGGGISFANIASRAHDKQPFTASQSPSMEANSNNTTIQGNIPTVRIPQDLWNVHENRDSSVFYISDPLERYRQVSLSNGSQRRDDVIDLHFQSTKTFTAVLEKVLPAKMSSTSSSGDQGGVWIVTGTGHHVGSKTHQKGGGALERAVIQWLQEEGYSFARGRDRNGLGGALWVKR